MTLSLFFQALPASAFADNFYSNPQICTIPEIPSTNWLSGVTRFPASSICQGPGAGSSSGTAVVGITGAGGEVGTAYIYKTFGSRLYITLQFECSYMFSTEPSFAAKRVQISIWNSPGQVAYQYVDVIYSTGYYNCYTLSVDLTQVCDVSQGAMFVASPNDPSTTQCVCPPGSPTCTGNPVVDLSGSTSLYIDARVQLGQFLQSRNGACQATTDTGGIGISTYSLSLNNQGPTIQFNPPECIPNPPPPPVPPPSLLACRVFVMQYW